MSCIVGHEYFNNCMLCALGWQWRPTTSTWKRWTLLPSWNHQLGYWLCRSKSSWCMHTYLQICPLDPWECHI